MPIQFLLLLLMIGIAANSTENGAEMEMTTSKAKAIGTNKSAEEELMANEVAAFWLGKNCSYQQMEDDPRARSYFWSIHDPAVNASDGNADGKLVGHIFDHLDPRRMPNSGILQAMVKVLEFGILATCEKKFVALSILSGHHLVADAIQCYLGGRNRAFIEGNEIETNGIINVTCAEHQLSCFNTSCSSPYIRGTGFGCGTCLDMIHDLPRGCNCRDCSGTDFCNGTKSKSAPNFIFILPLLITVWFVMCQMKERKLTKKEMKME